MAASSFPCPACEHELVIDVPRPVIVSEDLPAMALRPRKVAELLDIGRDSVYELIHTGQLPAIRIGKRMVVPTQSLEEWIQRKLKEGRP